MTNVEHTNGSAQVTTEGSKNQKPVIRRIAPIEYRYGDDPLTSKLMLRDKGPQHGVEVLVYKADSPAEIAALAEACLLYLADNGHIFDAEVESLRRVCTNVSAIPF